MSDSALLHTAHEPLDEVGALVAIFVPDRVVEMSCRSRDVHQHTNTPTPYKHLLEESLQQGEVGRESRISPRKPSDAPKNAAAAVQPTLLVLPAKSAARGGCSTARIGARALDHRGTSV